MHLDVCDPFNVQVREHYEYFITFKNDFSMYGYVYLMHRKFESFNIFKEFKAKAKRQLRKSLKALRSDRGSKYLSVEFTNFLTNHGIVSQFITLCTPQHNRVPERINRTLLDIVRSMISYFSLLTSF